jgi:RNA binding exosome subunit
MVEIISLLKIREIEFRTHAHATESILKVKDCLKKLIPSEIEDKEIIMENLAGNYGNPIRAFTLKITKQDLIQKVMINFGSMFTIDSKTRLRTEFAKHLDEKLKFYFRINKQLLTLGRIELNEESDVIRIVISVHNKNPKNHPSFEDVLSYFEKCQFF